ncbi:hypothetical protein V1512DRAFT_268458 [Lipomyces arxii]|uniref:uncharacterized protein n=1 Tax=Lipomyces arxii TaxID=56418 RepID=UPI0034CF527F
MIPRLITASGAAVSILCDDSSYSYSHLHSNSHSNQHSISDQTPRSASTKSQQLLPVKHKRYACQCGRSFTTSGHLARHTRIHTGEKNYVCPETGCGARFSRQDNCMQHFRTHRPHQHPRKSAIHRRSSSASSVSGASSTQSNSRKQRDMGSEASRLDELASVATSVTV